MPTVRLEALATVADLEATHGDFDRLEDVIRRDVGLSYKLLRYVNSAFFGLPRKVGSVREALTTLGARTVQQWATVLVLAGVAARGNELIATGLARARMCEDLAAAEACGTTGEDRCFTVGLFSVIDALLDAPMDEALAELPLVPEVTLALLERGGTAGRLLTEVLAYERGEFDALAGHERRVRVAASYRDAVAWADAAMVAIS